MFRICLSLVLVLQVSSNLRFCQVSGSCIRCPDKRYSYYKCHSQHDCFTGETCTHGFCCPNVQPNFSLQNEMAAQTAAATTLLCGANEQFSACHSPCQANCHDNSVMPCPSPTCQAGCHCQPGFVRRDGSQHSPCISRASCLSYDVTSHCADDRRQYQGCGSVCPVSCQNRNVPRRCHERCVSGCFCRVPYILENGEDPLHSRCILASQCPQYSPGIPTPIIPSIGYSNQFPQFPIVPSQPYTPFTGESYVSPHVPTVVPQTNKCADPLKNYISCGTKCPVGCNALSTSVSCSLQCVPGCFCRAPYILRDAYDPQSSCVLPQNCPSEPKSTSCSDPRKEWSKCGALSCARSCSNLLGRCSSGQCSAGCVCREPYVLQDATDPDSRCVLPSECERKCQDPLKEFITCGSSCPMGCDNLHPMSCTPCRTGCFCKNGLILRNSSNWETSKCVRIEDCKTLSKNSTERAKEHGKESTTSGETSTESTTTSTSTSTTTSTTTTTTEKPTTTTETEKTTKSSENGLMIDRNRKSDADSLSSECPSTTLDVGGRSCNRDTDCPTEQRCCRALIASLGVNPQRCSCPDPLAIWNPCGSRCPEYCGQPSVPVCSSTCKPGCQCAPGYVRVRNDVTAPCIPREACAHAQTEDFARDEERTATMREIPYKEDKTEETVASATLSASDVSGKFFFTKMENGLVRVTGTLEGLPLGSHTVVLHQLGDVSAGCSKIGPPLHFRNNPTETAGLGDINVFNMGVANFLRQFNWPISDVIGRSIAVYRFSSSEWSSNSQKEAPIACGTIGLAN